MILRAGHAELTFPRPALVMGILNVTPDSFSDGGQFLEPSAALDRAFQLVDEGAEIIDVGGESTRPGAVPVRDAEELRRVMPVLEKLAGTVQSLISIDTYKAVVAREAVRAGVQMINNIAGHRDDPEMWGIAAESRVAYVLMHMQGTPQTMHIAPRYRDIGREVGMFFEDRMKMLIAAGVSFEQIVLDVGIGFAKDRQHNLALLGDLASHRRLARPLMLGVSRKSFLGQWSRGPAQERLPAALAVTCGAIRAGAQIIRTHDVRATLQCIRATEEILRIEHGGA